MTASASDGALDRTRAASAAPGRQRWARLLHIAFVTGLVLGALGFYGSYLLGPAHFWPSFALLLIAGGAMYGWLTDATGGQGVAFLVMAVSLAASAALMPLVRATPAREVTA